MIKFSGTNRKTGDPIVGLGLSYENLRRLKAGQPIRFNLSEMNLPPAEVLIFAGKTEEGMKGHLAEYIDLPKGDRHGHGPANG
jgi:hypothetical protein